MKKENILIKFAKDFFGALDNLPGGHSLKKWLAVGMYWLVWYVTMTFTNEHNVIEVMLIHSGNMLILAGVYTYSNLKKEKEKLSDQLPEIKVTTKETPNETQINNEEI